MGPETRQQLHEWRCTSDVHAVVDEAVNRSMARGVELTDQSAPLMVLWAILRWETNLAVAVLKHLGVAPRAVEDDVDRMLLSMTYPRKDPPRMVYIVGREQTDYVTRVIDAGYTEANGLNHSWVGTEHLLLAVVRSPPRALIPKVDVYQLSPNAIEKAIRSFLGTA